MKNTKKLLSLLLVAVMLLGLLAGCGGQSPDSPAKLGSAGAFTKWFGAQKKSLSNLQTAGTYYFKLTKDITLRQPAVVAGGHAVVIDMDGHTITAKEGVNAQIFTVGEGTSLTLKNGAITTTGADADGGLIAVTGAGSGLHLEDVALTNTDDSFVQEMFSGGVLFVNAPVDGEPAVVTLSGSTVITGAAAGVRRNGGAVTAKGNAEIHMYGGTIQDGQAGCSGNVYLADQAKFYMHDGVITGGAAVGKSETTGLGGNVDIRGQARFYLYGGTITAGMAKKRGGNIFVSSFGTTGTVDGFHIYGGTVIASGNMLDRLEEGGQNYAVFTFAQSQKGGSSYTLKNAAGESVAQYTPANDFSVLVVSAPELTEGEYTFWQGEKQLAASSRMGGGFGGMMPMPGGRFPGGMEMPEGMDFPEGMEPPEGMKFPEGMQMPEGMEFPGRGEGGRGENAPKDDMTPPEGAPTGMFRPGGNRDWQSGETAELSTVFTIVDGANYFSSVAAAQ
jgi:hypothetical protein